MDAFLEDGAGAGCLVVLGEAGVGKTTLWRHGVETARARGFTLLISRPLELDMRVPFAGLRDLFGDVYHGPARRDFDSLRDRAAVRGRVYDQAHAILNLAQVEWRAGRWDRAGEHIREGVSLWPRGDPSARALALWIGAVLASHRGQIEAARADAEEGIAAASDHLFPRARNLWVLGFAAMCAGELDDALVHLGGASDAFDRAGALEPGMRLFESDLLDAYLAAGELAHAESLADDLLRCGTQLARPRAMVIGARAKGLVLAARDELDAALGALSAAATEAERWRVPLEHGRTLLALGGVQRRARRRRDARASLVRARQLFETLGAPLFVERAEAELGRIAGRTPTGQSLTPGEERIAELVARGLTNREVAAELVVAIHTVESALTRIYSKLGVRSRSELAGRWRERSRIN
jgi:ATP/maltotriose-dependent transcriptional regulator MalT